jgi:hypothetical protein
LSNKLGFFYRSTLNPQTISIYRRFGFQKVPEQTTIVFLKDHGVIQKKERAPVR